MQKGIVTAALAALLVAGCQGIQSAAVESSPGSNTGTLVGSEVASGQGEPAVGAIEGITIGAELGRSLAESDRPLALKAEYETLEYGRAGAPGKWENPETGNSGQVVAGAAYEVNRLDCREYTHTVSIGGRTRVSQGIACRQPGGTWRMLN
jgi:surface antigen